MNIFRTKIPSVTKLIRKIDESVKAILVTAWEKQSIGDEMKKYCVKILEKPVSGEVLVEEVNNVLINAR